MKFEEIPAPKFSLRVNPKNTEVILPTEDLLSVELTRVRGEFDLFTKQSVFSVVPTNPVDINQLSDLLASGRTFLAKLTDPAPDGSALLNMVQFCGEKLEMGDLEIGIDEKVQAASVFRNSRRFAQETVSLDEIAKRLKNNSVLEHGGKYYFFILAGDAAREDLEGNRSTSSGPETNDDETDGAEKSGKTVEEDEYNEENRPEDRQENRETENHRNFAILGADFRFALAEKDKGNGTTIFLASRITRILNNNNDSALRLACGNLKFVDWTVAGERALLAKSQLEQLTQNENSYLSRWDEFLNVEGELFFELARKLGVISFCIKEENKDGTIVIQCKNLTEEQKEILAEESSFDFVDVGNIPEFLNVQDMTFSDYANSIIKKEGYEEFLGEENRSERKQSKSEERITLTKRAFQATTGELILEAESSPSDQKCLVYSIIGQIAQLKRRLKARNNIQNGRAANPNLGLLIEEAGHIPPTQRPPKIKTLSDFVKSKVFPSNPPTLMQRKAIEVALNTPDIALIQGPPGTGKTTVIAAILERLNEESEKNSWLSGRVLLTGFQHDAVENLIGRISLNGLPVPKFGQRSGEENNEDLSRFERQLQEWCLAKTTELRAKNPQIIETFEEKDFRFLCVQYIKAPTLTLAAQLLQKAIGLSDRILGENLRKRLQKELAGIRKELHNEQESENQILPFIRGIRTTEKGFEDDGPFRAAEALDALANDDLDEADRDLLEKASKWYSNDTPPFIKDLRELKNRLLLLYTPAPVFRIEKARDTVTGLVQETIQAIRNNGTSARDKKTAALAELLLEMENNPEGIQDTVKDYCFAFAATCQQSVNQKMQNMKEKLEYDFVIVDEAARVSPLDLMVAMAQGKRIILVGDHRQLPQLINEDVVRKMEKEIENDTMPSNKTDADKDSEGEWLKKSMFEYLFTERLPALEKKDKIQRRVTLDKQYRMHPMLGNFVSRNFYEHFNPEEKFQSGLPESHFTQNLSGTNGKCAVWLNVPLKEGQMKKEGVSWTRPIEADVICNKVKEWITEDDLRTDDPKRRLSFGVIAFYKAQTEYIKKRLGNKFLEHVGEERLRIGTVDSFQGMEFDVVFLSLVRTTIQQRRFVGKNQFGFLQLYNRLNVSMSRQKKLLVVVGDSAFFDTDIAKEKVPALADFLKLCREKGRVL